MEKIKKIIIGTNNKGKYKEICDLLPKKVEKYSPKDFKIKTPNETGKTFKKNSFIKAAYFSKKTNMICLADDSGLEINILNGKPGIHSARWGGKKKNFNLAISKVYKRIKIKKNKQRWNSKARFVCCLTLYWPSGKHYASTGYIKGNISNKKKGKKGFGYDPIFIPNGFKKTFGEMQPKLKMSMDHRSQAFKKIKFFFFNKH